MKMEQTECSETSAYKIQTPGNHPKDSIQHWNLFTWHRQWIGPCKPNDIYTCCTTAL